jgi:uncharacterized OB-fold protein
MSENRPGLPSPTLSVLTEGYWKAAGEGRLVLQRCGRCGAHRHPPTAACYRCQSLDWAWDDVVGTATVFTYTWVEHPVHPATVDYVPFNVAVVELDGTEGEPVRLATAVLGVDRDTLVVGLPVTVDFDPTGDGVALPVFRPSAARNR